ncbi:hypothetical protein SDC9_105058 [bioreactor metagenome]|uniref:LysM domain-containing protein n=1 Tax=bioreactor metagenome TaxID=1076179 RepID=A0A645AYI9_9ZZZZ|nr:M23 family metallopeptidase [Erysipelotrichaceae bacterium]
MKFNLRLKKRLIYILIILNLVIFSILAINAYKESRLVDAYQFTVDGESWFTVSDLDTLNEIIAEYQATYQQTIGNKADITKVCFVQNVSIEAVRVESDHLIDLAEAKTRLYANDSEAVYYTVEDGDTLWDISKNLDISFTEFVDLNSDIDVDRIWPGDQLLLKPKDPKLDVMVTLQSTVGETIPYTTEYITDSSLYSTQREVITSGIDGLKNVTYDITMVNGYESSTSVIKETVILEPSEAVVKVGTKRTLTIISSSNYGVVAGSLTSGYGWRTDPISGIKKFHDGIDIGASCGSSVYAYAGGTVYDTGWNDIRGNYVIINHGNGLYTRYLHLSKISVSEGDSISVGDKIGLVGSTGYSTGCHLHFSVFVNGSSQNPFDYI